MISVTFRGQVYQIPEPTDANNQALTDYLNALSTGAVPFPTTADIDLGASFGLKALYFLTRAANAASNAAANRVRLALADLIAWRNNANNADIALGVGAQDQLQWRGSDVTGNPMLSVSSGAGQSIANGAVVIVVFGTVELDTDSGYTAGTGRYTVPTGKGGHYEILSCVRFGVALPTAPGLSHSIYKNALQLKAVQRVTAPQFESSCVSAIVNLAAGDIIDIRVNHSEGTAKAIDTNAAFVYFALKRIPA